VVRSPDIKARLKNATDENHSKYGFSLSDFYILNRNFQDNVPENTERFLQYKRRRAYYLIGVCPVLHPLASM